VCRLALLYATPVWAAAARSHIDRIQRMQNKFLRIILQWLAMAIRTSITDLYSISGVEPVDVVIARMISRAYNIQHKNSLISNVDNYELEDRPFRIKCKLPKSFVPLHP